MRTKGIVGSELKVEIWISRMTLGRGRWKKMCEIKKRFNRTMKSATTNHSIPARAVHVYFGRTSGKKSFKSLLSAFLLSQIFPCGIILINWIYHSYSLRKTYQNNGESLLSLCNNKFIKIGDKYMFIWSYH